MTDAVTWTEQKVVDVLERQRYAKPGNGGSGEYAFLRQVRNAAGFDASRTFDAVAISLWPSRGFEVHVFEVKTSRSDWLRELKDGAKAEAACAIADKFSIVAPTGIVQPGEVPGTWGLMEVTEKRVRTTTAAPSLRRGQKREDFPAGLVISMLRSAGAVPGRETPEEAALRAEFQRGRAEGAQMQQDRVTYAEDQLRESQRAVRLFQMRSGVAVIPAGHVTQESILEQADQIKAALADENHQARVKGNLQIMLSRLEESANVVRRLLE